MADAHLFMGSTAVRPARSMQVGAFVAGLALVAIEFGLRSVLPVLPEILGLVGVIVACTALTSVCRGGLRRIDFDLEAISLWSGDGLVRRMPLADLASVAVTGPVVAGVTIYTTQRQIIHRQDPAMLVFVDRNGRVVCARRIGWYRASELRRATEAVGLRWLGRQPVPSLTDLVPGSAPESSDLPTAPTALADSATADLMRSVRHEGWRIARPLWVVAVGLPALAIGWQVVSGHTPVVLGWIVGWAATGAWFALICRLCLHPRSRTYRALLDAGPWQLVEAIVEPGRRGDDDASHRRVTLVNPAGRSLGPRMTVRAGGERGWLQPLDRNWYLMSVEKGRRVALSDLSRNHVALLRVPRFAKGPRPTDAPESRALTAG